MDIFPAIPSMPEINVLSSAQVWSADKATSARLENTLRGHITQFTSISNCNSVTNTNTKHTSYADIFEVDFGHTNSGFGSALRTYVWSCEYFANILLARFFSVTASMK